MSQRKAYREAYPASIKWKDNVVDSKASELLKNGEVSARYNELQEINRKIAEEAYIMDSEAIMKFCTKVVLGTEKDSKIIHDPSTGKKRAAKAEASLITKAKYIDILCKMQGEYMQNVNVGGNLGIDSKLSKLSDEELDERIAEYGQTAKD